MFLRFLQFLRFLVCVERLTGLTKKGNHLFSNNQLNIDEADWTKF